MWTHKLLAEFRNYLFNVSQEVDHVHDNRPIARTARIFN